MGYRVRWESVVGINVCVGEGAWQRGIRGQGVLDMSYGEVARAQGSAQRRVSVCSGIISIFARRGAE